MLVVFSAAAIARRLSEGFAGIAVFFYFSVPRDFPSLCHALCIRNYIRSTERGNLYLQSPFKRSSMELGEERAELYVKSSRQSVFLGPFEPCFVRYLHVSEFSKRQNVK